MDSFSQTSFGLESKGGAPEKRRAWSISPKFFATAAELYALWPSFFNWAAGLIFPILAALMIVTWQMRGYKADADQGELKARIASLEGEIKILTQRLDLATE